jgi:D-alanine-D-alanine ligase
MGHLSRLRVVIVHNEDFHLRAGQDPSHASRADVVNAARDVARALASRGHEVSLLPVGSAPSELFAAVAELARRAPDLVFNLCESLDGDARHEALLPALLDLAGIPYTGSGPLALGLALRKDVTKRMLRAAGVPTPEAVGPDDGAPPFPLIVKPAREDASVGISRFSVVHDRDQLVARVTEVERTHGQAALVERYIDGRELYVSMIGPLPDVLPMHEIDFSEMPEDRPRIVSYEAKWEPGSPEYLGTRSVRARPIEESVRLRCEAVARAAFRALELRDYARVDLRLSTDGVPYVIDVNPNCDLSDGAGVSRAASFGGIGYAELIERIVGAALLRQQKENVTHARPSANQTLASLVPGDPGPFDPAPAAERSAAAVGAGVDGRAVHAGGDLRRARAHRRRAR